MLVAVNSFAQAHVRFGAWVETAIEIGIIGTLYVHFLD
jgi:hypothetical protein